MFSSIVSILALTAAASAKTIQVDVGMGGIVFSPNSTTAAVGDSIEFHFYAGSGPHSVVTGPFDAPCTPATAGGFFSSYIVGTDSGNETYTIPVTSTDPIWYYCSARMHCENGMVGVINPPSGSTLDQYAAAAKSAVSNVAPASTQIGGTATTLPASAVTGASSMSTTGSSSSSSTSSAVAASHSSSSSTAAPTSTSTGGAARQTLAAVGMMAAGGLALIV